MKVTVGLGKIRTYVQGRMLVSKQTVSNARHPKKVNLVHFHLPRATLSMPAIPQSERMATCSKNADQHPGTVDRAKKRQSKAEIEEEKEFQRIAKEEKKAKRQNGIMRIAMLEDKMAAEDQNANSAHPRHLSKFFFPSSPSHGL